MTFDAQKLIADIQALGRHFRGRSELIRHYEGKSLTRAQAMLAWCYDCSGFYDQGAADCENPWCPLHSFMPYRVDKGPKKPRSDKQIKAATRLGQRTREKGGSNKQEHVSQAKTTEGGI